MSGPVSPDRWRRISEVLDGALELPEAERAAFLDAYCASDPELRARVETLLEADRLESQVLDRAAGELATEALRNLDDGQAGPGGEGGIEVGARLGAWRAVREIGRGGMGVVYLAERADGQFEQRVALKVIRRGLDTDEFLARFLRERQILARLKHPGIVRLVDGGVTAGGRPWFALEHVDGLPITTYCDRAGLQVEARLRLFLGVCAAVQAAHRALVVHRDIKPSNILVTAAGEARLLDFGIARLLTGDADDPDALTRTGRAVMTPEYAAPEQIRGEPATTVTDVHGLGMVLYELLTGRRAYNIRGAAGAEEMRRVVGSSEVVLPSKAIGGGTGSEATGRSRAAAMGSTPGRLARRLRGDIDTIVMAALRKEPERRYASAEALARDIERHLAGLPVEARPDSLGYRLRKFAGRHTAALAGTLLVLLSLLAGLIGTAWQARTATREARKAEAIKDFLIGVFEVSDPTQARGEQVTARELLDQGARRIEAELESQPEVEEELLGIVRDIYLNLGLFDQAEPIVAKVLDKAERIYGRRSLAYAAALDARGQILFHRGDYEGSASVFREALALHQDLLGTDHATVAESLLHLGPPLTELGRYEETEGLYRRALDIRRERFGEDSLEEAAALKQLGLVLWRMGRNDEAGESLAEALEIRERRLGREHPDTINTMTSVAVWLSGQGRYEEAEPLFREAVAFEERHLGAEHPDLAETLNNYSVLLDRMGRVADSRDAAERSLEIRRTLYGDESTDVAASLNNIGLISYKLHDWDAAALRIREALAIWRRLLGDEHPHTIAALNNLGVILRETGDLEEAERLVREGLALRVTVRGEEHPDVAQSLRSLGLVLADRGRLREAGEALERSLDLSRKLYPEGHPRVAEVLVALGRLRLDQDRAAEAETALAEAVAIREAKLAEGDPRRAEAAMYLGAALSRLGRREEAEPILRDAIAVFEGASPEPDLSGAAEARAYLASCLAAGGKRAEAREQRAAALEALRRLLDEGHWRIRRAARIAGSA